MPLAAGNRSARMSEGGFSLLEVLVAQLLLSVVLFTVSQTLTLVLVRSVNAMELAHQEDQGARFVSSITLATKTATAWGIYSNMDDYTSGPDSHLVPRGNVLVCASTTPLGTPILYVFAYDTVSQTLRRFENNMNSERMTLSRVLPAAGPIFNQDLGLVQAHWTTSVRNQLLTFSAYGTPTRMR
jgi:Tfp pilus assembly protein PilV